MMEREEISAMKLANRIMREIYGLDAGERKSYKSIHQESDDIKDGALFLK